MTRQMKKLTGKCPVIDCYCEPCESCIINNISLITLMVGNGMK